MQQGPQTSDYKAAFKAPTSGIGLKFNPFQRDIVAVGTGENFGMVGAGKLYTLRLLQNGKVEVVSVLDEQEAVFDISWSEENEKLIALATNKAIKLVNPIEKKLISTIPQNGEIYHVEFSHKHLNLCLSSGIEGIIHLTDFAKGSEVGVFLKHEGCAYTATWHPSNEKLFASCGGDAMLKIWDISSNKGSIANLRAHEGEILSCDFNKYLPHIATSSIDKSIRIWDLRKLQDPISVLPGSNMAVRRVKYSPHEGNILASGGYDMNVTIWDLEDAKSPLKFVHKEHTEFVIALDFNLYSKRMIGSCGWDGRALFWNWDQDQPKIM